MATSPTINYEPLKNISNSGSRAAKAGFKGFRLPIYILFEAASIYVSYKANDFRPAFIIPVLVGAYIGTIANQYKQVAWAQFATANNWPSDDITSEEELVPPSANYGHSQKFSQVILAQLNNVKADLFTYECTTGSGRSSQTHYFTVARVDLPKDMPHILLLSKKAYADVKPNIDDSEELKLEGDFVNYFKLMLQKGQEVDVLQIITPDIMQALIAYNTNEDIEIRGRDLYFISRSDKRDYEDMPKFVQSIEELSAQIFQNINLASAPAAPAVGPNATPAAFQ